MRVLFLMLAAAAARAETPRVAIVIVVDQLRPDVLERHAESYRAGLRRVMEAGMHFRGEIAHAFTETGPGHSAIATGKNPARTGIVLNQWVDRATMRPVYCAEGHAQLEPALGDLLKEREPRAKVVAVSGKDRSAVLLGGRGPDAVAWYRRESGRFSVDVPLPEIPDEWRYEASDGARPDEDPREADRFSRTSPHPLDRPDAVYCSPYLDRLTAAAAVALSARHGLGEDDACDLLCVSFSAPDTVGHLYGPFSQEVRDTLLHLDEALGSLLEHFESRGVPLVAALTSDHGVLPFDGMRRVALRDVLGALEGALREDFPGGDSFRFSSGHVYVDRKAAARRGQDPAAIEAALERAARELDFLAAVFTRDEILGGGAGGELLELVRRSYHPDRGGDLVLVPARGVLVTAYAAGTSHGTPHDYDRRVPVVFFGEGVAPGRLDEVARTVDVAPTLGALLGISIPDADGSVLAPMRR